MGGSGPSDRVVVVVLPLEPGEASDHKWRLSPGTKWCAQRPGPACSGCVKALGRSLMGASDCHGGDPFPKPLIFTVTLTVYESAVWMGRASSVGPRAYRFRRSASRLSPPVGAAEVPRSRGVGEGRGAPGTAAHHRARRGASLLQESHSSHRIECVAMPVVYLGVVVPVQDSEAGKQSHSGLCD